MIQKTQVARIETVHSEGEQRRRAIPARVLVVEDEVLIADLLEGMIQGLGYLVQATVHDFQSAMEHARQGDFDIALLDILLGARGAYDIADVLRRKQKPFAFVTGYDSVPDHAHAQAPILMKPFTTEQLRALLEGLVAAQEC